MPLADATTLMEGRQFSISQHDPVADEQTLTAIADWCHQFSSVVAVDPPDSLCFDLNGVTHLFGDESKLANHVLKAFHARGYRPRVAIADTISAAWAAAHYGKTSSTIIPVGKTQWLYRLPLSALRIPTDALEKLDRLGVHRIEQLVELSRKNLPSRVGDEVLERLDCLIGNKTEMLCGHQSLPTFQQQWLLDRSTDHLETIQHVVDVLLRRLASQLRCYGHGAMQLSICFDCMADHSATMNIGLYRPSANSTHFNSLFQMQMETIKLPAAVECVTITADETEPLEQSQRSLLDTEKSADPREMANLIEKLSSRLGAERVVRAALIDDFQPEKSFCYQSLTQRNDSLPPDTNVAEQHECFVNRPVRMLFPPQQIDVIAVVPDGPPARFYYRGEQRVVNCWGPERLETAWWRGPSVKRDYYRVETESASRFWLFRCLSKGQWFLHGSFD